MDKNHDIAPRNSRTSGVLTRLARRIGKAIVVTPEQHAIDRGLHIALPDEMFANAPFPEISTGKARAIEVVGLMQRVQEATPPDMEPIGAYRSADAPDYHLRDVPQYLYDKTPDTKQRGEE